jgi:uncharacterized protein (DUF2252 family)
LSNFGLFASPERTLLFDLNDFDETLPGPFEYDVKRMAASFTIAARNNGFTPAEQRDVTLASVRANREAMAEFAQMRTMVALNDLRVNGPPNIAWSVHVSVAARPQCCCRCSRTSPLELTCTTGAPVQPLARARPRRS